MREACGKWMNVEKREVWVDEKEEMGVERNECEENE